MKCPIYIQTKTGFNIYKNELMRYNSCIDIPTLKKEYCAKSHETEQKISSLLDDTSHKMDEKDLVGWDAYKELSDKYQIYKYFGNKNDTYCGN